MGLEDAFKLDMMKQYYKRKEMGTQQKRWASILTKEKDDFGKKLRKYKEGTGIQRKHT